LKIQSKHGDNTLIKQKLGWAPSTPLLEGMQKTYSWIREEMHKRSGERRRAYC
jgi:nucleoside-diphosphate-sugar epimerase